MRLRGVAALGLLVALAVIAAGCGDSGDSAVNRHYSVAQLKAAYLRAADTPEPDAGEYWTDPGIHSHADFVPFGSVEICPLTQRANVPVGSAPVHVMTPKGGEPAGQLVLDPEDADDHQTPVITQSALVFGTSAVAQAAMAKVQAAMEKCPASYVVRGGPPQILGSYALNSRPIEIDGWTGVAQQLAHGYQASEVYYEDVGHVVLQRDNVILDLLLSHEHVVGDRADSGELAEAAAKTILKRLDA